MESAYLLMYALIGLQAVSVIGSIVIAGWVTQLFLRNLLCVTLASGTIAIVFFGQKAWAYGPQSYLIPLLLAMAFLAVHLGVYARKKKVGG